MKEVILIFVSAIGGGVVTLVAPWVKWELEKKKRLHEERKQLIARARAILTNKGLSINEFVNTIEYSQVRSLLSAELKSSLEQVPKVIEVNYGNFRYGASVQLIDEIHKIEKKWKLI